MTIREEIIQMIEAEKPVTDPVREDSHLYKDLGFESYSFIRFLLKIEETYAITFEIMEMERCLQADRLIALVECKVKERAGNHD